MSACVHGRHSFAEPSPGGHSPWNDRIREAREAGKLLSADPAPTGPAADAEICAERRDRLNHRNPHVAQTAFGRFFTAPLEETLTRHEREDPVARALALFHHTAETVPAYRQFLEEHGIARTDIRTPDDFRTIPPLTKRSYVERYSLPERCRGGDLSVCDMLAVSSGSTGAPTVWPRSLTDELHVAARFEQVFHDSFDAMQRRTLAIVCFTLGAWVGGMYTAACCRHLASKGYRVTVVTPGTNTAEIYRIVREIAPLFDQTVLLGYPPFLKDVVDGGIERGIDWQPLAVTLVMAGEVFSEEWRSLVCQRVGSADILRGSASIYGTADAGVLGNETPLSIAIRRFLAQAPAAARELFGESRLPTLVQYDPSERYFEMADGRLLFTGDNGVPLIRYDILDSGGLLSFDEMLAFATARGFDTALVDVGPLRRLPFVWVFGRSDFTVSYYGANIYPENVTVGLEQEHVRDRVTGKFVMETREDADRNRSLFVVVELAASSVPDATLADAIAASIQRQLERLNSEFANYVPPGCRTPRVELRGQGDAEWFPVGVKHRYTRRS